MQDRGKLFLLEDTVGVYICFKDLPFIFFCNYTKLADLAFLYYFVVKSKNIRKCNVKGWLLAKIHGKTNWLLFGQFHVFLCSFCKFNIRFTFRIT